jgi:neamine transaminase/2'-deamino-2'-hydroxyneamine transaminase/neomycin C transaminase
MYAIERENGETICFHRANGAYLYDEEGKDYIDLWNAFGSITLGYCDKDINRAIAAMIRDEMISMCAPNEYLNDLRELLLKDYPLQTSVGIFTSGTQAVRAAIFAALKHSGRDLIVSAGYHGWDPMWQQANVMFEPNRYHVIDCYYILEEFEKIIAARKNEIAVVVISPEQSYFSEAYYEKVFSLCQEYRFTIIVDDVKCGYRYQQGSSLDTKKFQADLYVVSKCIANGARISCVIGNDELMRNMKEFCYTSYYDIYPLLSAVVTLKKIKKNHTIAAIRAMGDRLIDGLEADLSAIGLPIKIVGNGNLFQFILGSEKLNSAFYRECMRQRIYLYENDNQCPSYAFNDTVVVDTLRRFHNVFVNLAQIFSKDLDKKISNERILIASFEQTLGCAEAIPYSEKLNFIRNTVFR